MKVTAIDRRAHPPQARFSVWHPKDRWPIRRMDWLQPPGAVVRGSLIFAGGRGDFIEKYLEPLGHWHERGWNVTSFDWRSQGESRGDIEGGHLDSFDPVVADGAALIADWLEGEGPHVAVGHSMGGHLLLRILADHQPAIDAAVLVAPMIGINSSPLPPWLAPWIARSLAFAGWSRVPLWPRIDDRFSAGEKRQRILTSCRERHSDEAWWFDQQPGFSLGAPSWGWLAAAYRSIAALGPGKLRAVQTPILLLGTERDRLVSPPAIRRAAGLLPKAELMMFPGAGHEILREVDAVREQALARIDSFFEEHARA
jgi:lysophospholipase